MSSFVGAYWTRGAESKMECLSTLVNFLTLVSRVDPKLQSWFKKGREPKASSELDINDLTAALTQNLREDDKTPIAEFGYRFSAWNGRTDGFQASLSANLGNASGIGTSNISIRLGREWSRFTEVLRAIFQVSVEATDPDNAILFVDSSLIRTDIPIWGQVGDISYSRAGGVVLSQPTLGWN